MSYKIKAEYSTGDSNDTYDETLVLDMQWKSLQNATNALKRIEEHYHWYRSQHGWDRSKKVQRPEWSEGLSESVIVVLLDNANPVQFAAPWCGYFEHLYRCSIVDELPYFEA
jgi:hypothetical protein